MEFLVLWLGTIVASFGLEIAKELRMLKDVADAGYKINMERLSEIHKQINQDVPNATLQSMLIPVLNVMLVFQRTVQYYQARPMILSQLSVIDALEEMSEIEKTEYLKKPTGLNALIIQTKAETRLLNAKKIQIKDGNDYSEFYYEMGESLDDITILKVSGSASRLTVEEQKKMIIEALKPVAQSETEKQEDEEPLNDTLKNSTSIDLNDSKEEKKEEETTSSTPQELSLSEQKQALENLKNELLEEKEVEQSSQKDGGPKLSKRK